MGLFHIERYFIKRFIIMFSFEVLFACIWNVQSHPFSPEPKCLLSTLNVNKCQYSGFFIGMMTSS